MERTIFQLQQLWDIGQVPSVNVINVDGRGLPEMVYQNGVLNARLPIGISLNGNAGNVSALGIQVI